MSCRLSSTSCRAHGLSYWEASAVQLFGHQMAGRKSYNPKNKGKKSYQPVLTFLSETREYVSGELRNGGRPTGVQIARHLESVFAALPPAVYPKVRVIRISFQWHSRSGPCSLVASRRTI
jgi:hypothetical protein